MINALYKEANSRGFEGQFKRQWIATEFSQLNQTVHDKFEDLTVNQASKENMNFALADYFKERGLATAAKSIEKNWMHYQFGSKINESFLKD